MSAASVDEIRYLLEQAAEFFDTQDERLALLSAEVATLRRERDEARDLLEAERQHVAACEAEIAQMHRYAGMYYRNVGRWLETRDRMRRWARAWKRLARAAFLSRLDTKKGGRP